MPDRVDRCSYSQAGAHLDLALPQGEFSEFVDAGYGLVWLDCVNLDRHGTIALRLDGSYLHMDAKAGAGRSALRCHL